MKPLSWAESAVGRRASRSAPLTGPTTGFGASTEPSASPQESAATASAVTTMMPTPVAALALVVADSDVLGARLVEDWLAATSPLTRAAYAGDVRRFADWWDGKGSGDAVTALLLLGPRDARSTVLSYRAHLIAAGKAASTVNRALAALRSVVTLAHDLGIVDWDLRVKGLVARAYRDTAGPARADVKRIVAATTKLDDAVAAARDGAILRLLYGLGLRRSEAVALDIKHVDLERALAWIIGKGKHDRAPLSMPVPVVEAVRAWLAVRPGNADGPLFVALDRAHHGGRLTSRSIARVLERACADAGTRRYAPHALRHSAITHALDATKGDVRKVRAFSRHSSLETLLVYDDNRADAAGAVASLVAL